MSSAVCVGVRGIYYYITRYISWPAAQYTHLLTVQPTISGTGIPTDYQRHQDNARLPTEHKHRAGGRVKAQQATVLAIIIIALDRRRALM